MVRGCGGTWRERSGNPRAQTGQGEEYSQCFAAGMRARGYLPLCNTEGKRRQEKDVLLQSLIFIPLPRPLPRSGVIHPLDVFLDKANRTTGNDGGC